MEFEKEDEEDIIKLKQPLTYENIKKARRTYIPLSGEFQEVFSNPQDKGVWLIWGSSGSGKSSFVMQLVAELVKHYKVLYNSKEEDPTDDEFFDRMEMFGVGNRRNNFQAAEDNINELMARLSKKASAKVVIIDSATYFFTGETGRPLEEYFRLTKAFPDKIFIITAHAKGEKPRTELETSIMFDARMKIFVDAYAATNKGRKYGRKNPYIIWEEKYEELMGAKEN